MNRMMDVAPEKLIVAIANTLPKLALENQEELKEVERSIVKLDATDSGDLGCGGGGCMGIATVL